MGKLDRAVGAVCLSLAAFGAVGAWVSFRAVSSQPSWLAGLSSMPGMASLILALIAAIPGFFLVFRKGAI